MIPKKTMELIRISLKKHSNKDFSDDEINSILDSFASKIIADPDLDKMQTFKKVTIDHE